VRVDENPFRITVLKDGEPVITQDQGAHFRYQLLSSGEQHKLTKVTGKTESRSGGTFYEVATDETGRTALVEIGQTPQAVRGSVAMNPETDVQQVYDAFETKDDEHFLGSGERGEAVDLH